MKALVARLAKWLTGRHFAVQLTIQLTIAPGILLLSLLMPFKHGDHYSVGWTIAYAVINVLGLSLAFSLQAAMVRIETTATKSTMDRLVDAHRGAARAEAAFLREMIKARQRAESFPPERRAELLRRLDAVFASETSENP